MGNWGITLLIGGYNPIWEGPTLQECKEFLGEAMETMLIPPPALLAKVTQEMVVEMFYTPVYLQELNNTVHDNRTFQTCLFQYFVPSIFCTSIDPHDLTMFTMSLEMAPPMTCNFLMATCHSCVGVFAWSQLAKSGTTLLSWDWWRAGWKQYLRLYDPSLLVYYSKSKSKSKYTYRSY